MAKSVPLAILAGSFIIGAGLYFGLSARAPAPPAPPPAENKPAVDPRRVSDQVAAELAARKPRYVDECWAPALKADPSITTSRYRFMLNFDAQGKEIGRGISEQRERPSRPDVARCLRALSDLPIQIPAPGDSAVVQLDVDFP